MGVQTFEQILDTETLAADMTDTALVILIHGFHDKTYQTGGLVIQLGQIDFHGIVGRFTDSPSWMKSHISTFSNSGSSAYFTLKV